VFANRSHPSRHLHSSPSCALRQRRESARNSVNTKLLGSLHRDPFRSEEIFHALLQRTPYAFRVGTRHEWALVQRGKETVNDRHVIRRMSRGSREDARKRSLPLRGGSLRQLRVAWVNIVMSNKAPVTSVRSVRPSANNARGFPLSFPLSFSFSSQTTETTSADSQSLRFFSRHSTRCRDASSRLVAASDRSVEGNAAAADRH